MTTICNLPEEVLSMVFVQLSTSDLLQCQRVCPAWYPSAHSLLLRVIKLTTRDSKVQKFISSIDYNPCLKYLQAVKEMHITTTYDSSYSKGDVYKLLFRFPNLTKVKLNGKGDLLDEFTDDKCIDLLEKCPKLDYFEADCSFSSQNSNRMYKVRLLVTAINLFYCISRDQNIVQCLTSYPRLQEIKGSDVRLNSFQQLLQILQQLANLKDITMHVHDDQDHLVDRHFATTTENELDILINRLSKITRFQVKCPLNVCVNSMHITKYLTGLKSFIVALTCDGADWTDQEEQLFTNILNLICKFTGKVKLYNVQLSNCGMLLPIIEDKVLTSKSRFRLRIGDPCLTDERLDLVYLSTKSSHYGSKLTTQISGQLDVYDFILEILVLNSITALEVVLDGENGEYYEESNTCMYAELLKKFPMATKMTLDIPRSYTETAVIKTFPLIEELRLQLSPDLDKTFEGLSRFAIMFPNLKHLDLCDFGGVWRYDSKDFWVDLSNYSLQRLTMDFTPVKSEISERLKNKKFDEEDFYVVELILAENHRKHLYKLTLKTLSARHISESDLQDCTDYIRVKININSLQRFEVYFAAWNVRACKLNLADYTQKTHNYGCIEVHVPHITLFNDD